MERLLSSETKVHFGSHRQPLTPETLTCETALLYGSTLLSLYSSLALYTLELASSASSKSFLESGKAMDADLPMRTSDWWTSGPARRTNGSPGNLNCVIMGICFRFEWTRYWPGLWQSFFFRLIAGYGFLFERVPAWTLRVGRGFVVHSFH